MPEVLFAGGRLDSVEVISGSPSETTTSSRFDSAYADAAIAVTSSQVVATDFFTQSGGVLTPHDVVTGETLWVHLEFYASANVNSDVQVIALFDSSGYPWLSMRKTTTATTFGIYYNSGTGPSPTWTLIDTTFVLNSTQLFTLDIKLELGSPHAMEFSVDGTLTRSGTFTQASLASLRTIQMRGVTTNAANYSQIMVTEGISTIGAKVKTIRASGAGTNTAWSGAYTDVNEAVGSDASVQSSASAGQKETHAMGDVSLSTGQEIAAVFHWMRAKNDGAAPTNVHSVVRSGGTDYATADLSGIGTSYGPVGARYDGDPDTGSNWTQGGFNAAEFGFESAA